MAQDSQTWLGTPLGQRVWLLERKLVQEALGHVFGWQLLQIGLWGEGDALIESARTQRRLVLDRCSGPAVQLVSRADELAVASDSIDAVLLPHTLEHEADPHQVLREVSRVLAGDGQLIILGFRSFSSWGLRHALARDGFPPGIERTIGDRRLRDWLKLLGFEVTDARRYLYTLPWGRTVTRSQRFLEATGERVWPIVAGAYLLKARKRVYCMTPVRVRWQRRTGVVGGLMEPTTRNRL
jgi:SAM-dependent methyltransferase